MTPLDALGLCYIHTVYIPRETMRVKKQIFVLCLGIIIFVSLFKSSNFEQTSLVEVELNSILYTFTIFTPDE